MDCQVSYDSDSNLVTSSRLSKTNSKKDHNLNDSEDSESYILNKAPKKSHDELRNERINELNECSQKHITDGEYEEAMILMKKLIFFEPNSKQLKE